MAGAFLIMLREGFEAALIVGIILAVVVRVAESALKRHVFAGVGVAVLASLCFALVADRVSDLFGGAGQEVMNGTVLMLAAAMITYMVVWLKESRKGIQQQLAAQVHQRVERRGMGLFVLAFLSVFREGVESVLFLWGILAGGRDDASSVLIGAVLGLATAVVIAWAVFQGGRRIPLGAFFSSTTVLLVLLAAGMLAHGVGYWVAVDWLPALAYSVWDTSNVLPERSGLGELLAVLIGYNANPTLMEVLAWGGYLAAVGAFLLWGGPDRSAESPSAPAT